MRTQRDEAMTTTQPCARWGCEKEASYDKPLRYPHWQEYERWDSEECSRCHQFYDDHAFVIFLSQEWDEVYSLMCDDCLYFTLEGHARPEPAFKWMALEKPKVPEVIAHAPLVRPRRYVYVLKLSDASFYVGQTVDLDIRLREHRGGVQRQTKGRDPRLVYYEEFEGNRPQVNTREDELTKLRKSGLGRRRLFEMIEDFRVPLRLLDLEA